MTSFPFETLLRNITRFSQDKPGSNLATDVQTSQTRDESTFDTSPVKDETEGNQIFGFDQNKESSIDDKTDTQHVDTTSIPPSGAEK